MTRPKRLSEAEAIARMLAMLDTGHGQLEAETFFINWLDSGNRGGRNKIPGQVLHLAADFCRHEIAAGLLMPSGKLKRDKLRETRMLAYIEAHGHPVADMPLRSFDVLLRAGVTAAKASPRILTQAEKVAQALANAKRVFAL